MIQGVVNRDKTPTVPISVLDGERNAHPIRAIVDTGFEGDLMLPGSFIRRVGLARSSERSVVLADGSHAAVQSYAATVSWMGRETPVIVLESESQYLLGVSLLWGSKMTMAFEEGGSIVIEDLPARA